MGIFGAFIGLSGCFSGRTYADKNLPMAPCSFPFDASHKGVVLQEKFNVKTYRHYIFKLEFHHNGGEEADRLSDLLDASYAVFLADSINSGHPIRVISDDFMEKKYFSPGRERNAALTEAEKKYSEAMWSAILSKDNNKKYVWLPQKLDGLIPIIIEITKIEPSGERVFVSRESLDTLGTYAGGNGRFLRQITVKALRPGTYEVRAETVRDSPLFFATPIRLGVEWHPNVRPLKD